MLDPVAPCATVGPPPFCCPSSQAQPQHASGQAHQPHHGLQPAKIEAAAAAPLAAARSWAALAPTASEDLSAEDWLVVAGGAW